jgi:hypothetical protein
MSDTGMNNDEVLFDRLVDGELSQRERQELLTSLDGRPDGWRRCALALLEAQTWRHEFGAFVHATPGSTLLTSNNEAPPVAERVRTTAPSPHAVRPERWFTLAASLLLAFGVGWSFRGSQQSQSSVISVPNEIAETGASIKLPQVDGPQLAQQNSRDAVTLLVRDVDGHNRRLQLPLVEVASGKSVDGANLLPAGVREGLQNRGLDLRHKRRYAPLYFEQGGQVVPMVVPVEDTYVVPVKREVF